MAGRLGRAPVAASRPGYRAVAQAGPSGAYVDGGRASRTGIGGDKDRRPTSGGPGSEENGLSAASTPVRSPHADWRTAPNEEAGFFGWQNSDERFILARNKEHRHIDARSPLPVLNGRLFFATAYGEPAMQAGVHFFSTDKFIRYMPFCADFGPFNLGMTHQFGMLLKEILLNPKLKETKIVYFTTPDVTAITNAVYLLGSFMVTHLGMTPDEAWTPFAPLNPSPFRPYRDATWAPSPFDLTVKDCWAGLLKAKETNLYIPSTFDKDEYLYYDHPANGDMHEVVRGKFFAFKGPTGRRRALGYGRYSLIPSDYFDVWRSKNITTVVRLNTKEYDRNVVVQGGFKHIDLFFIDCSTPSDAIVDKFLRIAETETGAIAVHCLAGLGRTGTLIALYMMKHMRFTAREAMGWLRICRPGSVIGPQQQYLVDNERRMWELGERKVLGLGLAVEPSLQESSSDDPNASKLAEMVTKGMQNRDLTRVSSSQETLMSARPAPAGLVRQPPAMLASSPAGSRGGSPTRNRPNINVSTVSANGRPDPSASAKRGSTQPQLLSNPSTPSPRTPVNVRKSPAAGMTSSSPKDTWGGDRRSIGTRASVAGTGSPSLAGGQARLRMSVR